MPTFSRPTRGGAVVLLLALGCTGPKRALHGDHVVSSSGEEILQLVRDLAESPVADVRGFERARVVPDAYYRKLQSPLVAWRRALPDGRAEYVFDDLQRFTADGEEASIADCTRNSDVVVLPCRLDFVGDLGASLDAADAADKCSAGRQPRCPEASAASDGELLGETDDTAEETAWLARAAWATASRHRDLASRSVARAQAAVQARCRTACNVADELRADIQERLFTTATLGLSQGMPRTTALSLLRRATPLMSAGTVLHGPRACAWRPDAVAVDTLDLVGRLGRALRDEEGRQPQADTREALLLALRDQAAMPISGSGDDAGSRLIAQGRPAVPMLIDALENDGITRVVQPSWPRECPGRNVARVGDVALEIIEEIAHRTFDIDAPADGTPESPPLDGPGWKKRAALRRAVVLAWWNEMAGRSDDDVLLHALSHGGEQRPDLLHDAIIRMCNRAGGAPIDAILARALAQAEGATRRRALLVQLKGGVCARAPAMLALLRDATQDPDGAVRVQAAADLLVEGDVSWATAMRHEVLSGTAIDPGVREEQLGLLLATGTSEAIDAVAERLRVDPGVLPSPMPLLERPKRAGDHEEHGRSTLLLSLATALEGKIRASPEVDGGPHGSPWLGGARLFLMLQQGSVEPNGGAFELAAQLRDALISFRRSRGEPVIDWPDAERPSGASASPDRIARVRVRTNDTTLSGAVERWAAPLRSTATTVADLFTAVGALVRAHPGVDWRFVIARFRSHAGIVLDVSANLRVSRNGETASLWWDSPLGQIGWIRGVSAYAAFARLGVEVDKAWRETPDRTEETVLWVGTRAPDR